MIQADLRDARLRLLANDYVTLAAELDLRDADEAATAARRAELEQRSPPPGPETGLEQAEQEHAPRLAAAQQAWFALSRLAERLRGSVVWPQSGTVLPPPEPQRPGRDPDELEHEAADAARAGSGARRAAVRGPRPADHFGQAGPRPRPRCRTTSAGSPRTPRPRSRSGRAAGAAPQPGRVRPGQPGGGQGRRGPAGRGAGAGSGARRARAAPVRAVQDLAWAASRAGPSWPPHEQATAALAAASARVAEQRKAEHQASGTVRRCAPGRDADRGGQARRGRDRPAAVGESQVGGGRGVRRAAHRRGQRRRGDRHCAGCRGRRGHSMGSTPPEILAGLKGADAGRADLVIAAPPNGHGPGRQPAAHDGPRAAP